MFFSKSCGQPLNKSSLRVSSSFLSSFCVSSGKEKTYTDDARKDAEEDYFNGGRHVTAL